MIVNNAMMNIVSTWIVSFTIIQTPYAHAGNDISNIVVAITTSHNDAGDT
jgi:hypothetical protein